MKTLKSFVAESHLDETLIRAVVRQVGNWESFREIASDVARHGANAGWVGFTYYTDTVKFFNNNREQLRSMAIEMADEMGLGGPVELICGFNCLRGSVSYDEVASTLYGPKRDVDTQVSNAMAWFALEEVCRSYDDLTA